MMNENVKIKINEVDLTSPAGSGTDSTDIAFIPGFSVNSDAPKNKPILCTSVKEFENLFGTIPYRLSTSDIKEYENLGFVAGTYDRSYIYAKELLNSGLSVVYCNVSSVNLNSLNEPEANFVELEDYKDKASTNLESLTYDSSEKIFSLKMKKNATNVGLVNYPACIEITDTVVVDKESTKTINIVASAITKNAKIDSYTVKVDEDVKVDTLSNSCIEIINDSSESTTCNYTITLNILVTMEYDPYVAENNLIKISLGNLSGSNLDVFYKVDSNTNKYPIQNIYDLIADKSIYSVKYITSGGYPAVTSKTNANFATSMLDSAEFRGDAVALIDYKRDEETVVYSTDTKVTSVYGIMQNLFMDHPKASFGTAMYPWGIYSCPSTLSFSDSVTIDLPASYGYLRCVSKAIKTSPNWLAMAGVTRGIVPGLVSLLVPGGVISNTIAEELQPKFGVKGTHDLSINCITNVRPYGLTLWGNRTLLGVNKDGTVALNFLNTRNMISDIKKLLYTTAKSLMFEQNSDTLWLKFKSGISPLLNQMKAGNGISDYKLIKGTTKYNGDPLTKGELSAVIKIFPVYAVEYFELTVEISDNDVTVS